MDKLILYIIRISLVFYLGVLQAQSYDLKTILDRVEQKHPKLKALQAQQEGMDFMRKMSWSWQAPKISLGAEEFPFKEGMHNMMGGINLADLMNRKMFMVGVEQMFPNFLEQKYKSKYYQSKKQEINHQAMHQAHALLAETQKAFYENAYTQKKLTLLQSRKETLEPLKMWLEKRMAYNKAEIAAYYNLKSEMAKLEVMRKKEENMLFASSQMLKELMGARMDSVILVDTLNLVLQNHDLSDDFTHIEAHPALVAMQGEIQSMDWQRKIKKTMLMPMFGVGFKSMRMNDKSFMYSVMLDFTLPIAPWSAREVRLENKAMKSEIIAMKYQSEAMQNMVLAKINTLKQELQTAYETLAIWQAEILPNQRKVFELYLHNFQENEKADLFQLLMVLDAELMQEMDFLELLQKTHQLEAEFVLETHFINH